jgi:hypothetical protein
MNTPAQAELGRATLQSRSRYDRLGHPPRNCFSKDRAQFIESGVCKVFGAFAGEESLHSILHGDKFRRACRRFAVADRSRLLFRRLFEPFAFVFSLFPAGGWPRLWRSFYSGGCPVQAPLGRGFSSGLAHPFLPDLTQHHAPN